ncbi:MAG: RNA polymerase sigma factor [Candidatus Izemoplasmatales bacterium]
MQINYEDYINLLIEKDDEAFQFVYENTKKGVFSMIISIVKNKAATEDLMQDTYIKMIEKIHQYKKGKNFYAWLLQIAKNTALDYYRKHKNEVVYDPQEQSYYHDSLKTDEKTYSVLDLVKPLNDLEKQIVLLRAVDQMKFKDIAQIVDKPLGTVLWIYNKAINSLKTYLEVEVQK